MMGEFALAAPLLVFFFWLLFVPFSLSTASWRWNSSWQASSLKIYLSPLARLAALSQLLWNDGIDLALKVGRQASCCRCLALCECWQPISTYATASSSQGTTCAVTIPGFQQFQTTINILSLSPLSTLFSCMQRHNSTDGFTTTYSNHRNRIAF